MLLVGAGYCTGNCMGFRIVFVREVSDFAFALAVNQMFFSFFPEAGNSKGM